MRLSVTAGWATAILPVNNCRFILILFYLFHGACTTGREANSALVLGWCRGQSRSFNFSSMRSLSAKRIDAPAIRLMIAAAGPN